MNLTKMNFARLRLLKRSFLFVSIGALASCSSGISDQMKTGVGGEAEVQLASIGQSHFGNSEDLSDKAAPPIEIAHLSKVRKSYPDESRLSGENRPQFIASEGALASVIQDNFPKKNRYALQLIDPKKSPEDAYHIMNIEDDNANPHFFLAKTAFDGVQQKKVYIRVQLFIQGQSLFARNKEQSYTQILYCKDNTDLLSVNFVAEELNSRVDVFCYDSQEDLERGNKSKDSFRETTIFADR